MVVHQLAMGTIGDVADVSRIFTTQNTAAAGGYDSCSNFNVKFRIKKLT